MRRCLFIKILILGLCIAGNFVLPHCTREGKLPASAPDFTLKTLVDQEITLSQLKGKVVLLDFWATWCGPCRESIPFLVQLHNAFQEKGLEVIGMNMDKGDIEIVRRFVKSMNIPYPITVTTEDVTTDYSVTALPTTVFIDKTGKVRQKFVGFSSEISRQITATVAELTSENPQND